ncbi:MAG: MFS transporter [Chloroflexi bacterium]|nr:MFS transporter [Chloroflexota bacterium]
MKRSKPFLLLMLADFVARSAYQMGKTPLLPIFAAALGASGAFLGLIVSVSTVTGLFLKPLFGILSDRWGRRVWLFVGAGFFAVTPFLYRFVQTPEQLLALRLAHGLATAIYGPVTLAYIAELSREARRHSPVHQKTAENIGWFQMARSGGYIVGPALAGWLLLSLEPVAVFTLIGIISCGVFLPIMHLPETRPLKWRKRKDGSASARPPIRQHIKNAIRDGGQSPAVWLTGGLEAVTFIALYTLKAFLPLYALEAGVSIVLVGLFFSLNEAAHVLGKPFCGRLGDRWGYLPTISLGMLILAAALPLVRLLDQGLLFLLPAALMGLAQALIFPAAIAMVSDRISPQHLGAGMGLIGMMQNFGKVAGPILGGLAISALGYEATLISLSLMLALGAAIIWSFCAPRKLINTAP